MWQAQFETHVPFVWYMCALDIFLNVFYYNNDRVFVFVGFGGGGEDDTRTISDKECGQTRSETASGREG